MSRVSRAAKTPHGRESALTSYATPSSPFTGTGRNAMDQGHKRRGADTPFSMPRARETKLPAEQDGGFPAGQGFLPTASLGFEMAQKTDMGSTMGSGSPMDTVDNGASPTGLGSNGPRCSAADRQRSVIVFGFQRSKFSLVQHHFSDAFGPIEDVDHGCGNWVTLQFETPQQAQRALSQSWMQLDGNTMVGVCPCSEKLVQAVGVAKRRTSVQSRHRFASEIIRPYALDDIAKECDSDRPLISLTGGIGGGGSRGNAPLRRRDGLCRRVMQWLFNM